MHVRDPRHRYGLRRAFGKLRNDLEASGGKQKWRFTTPNSIFSSPAIGADGTIYVGSEDNSLYAVH
jgi:outer membrane protein assembly factor BamB